MQTGAEEDGVRGDSEAGSQRGWAAQGLRRRSGGSPVPSGPAHRLEGGGVGRRLGFGGECVRGKGS